MRLNIYIFPTNQSADCWQNPLEDHKFGLFVTICYVWCICSSLRGAIRKYKDINSVLWKRLWHGNKRQEIDEIQLISLSNFPKTKTSSIINKVIVFFDHRLLAKSHHRRIYFLHFNHFSIKKEVCCFSIGSGLGTGRVVNSRPWVMVRSEFNVCMQVSFTMHVCIKRTNCWVLHLYLYCVVVLKKQLNIGKLRNSLSWKSFIFQSISIMFSLMWWGLEIFMRSLFHKRLSLWPTFTYKPIYSCLQIKP